MKDTKNQIGPLQLQNFSLNEQINISINAIYSQIAKINGNPNRVNELEILVKTISNLDETNIVNDSIYVEVSNQDVLTCFKNNPIVSDY